MIDQVHVVAQPIQDLRMRTHVCAGLGFALDDAACGGDLTDAEEGRDRLFRIAVLQQPVRGDDGRIQGIGAGNGHVAARGGGEEGRTEEKVVGSRRDIGGECGVRQGKEFSLGPVGREGV